ncbi:uncharacterized protein [Dysidea avara]|uniref:uncharacterized protein n=1 Tax=Dysidea avara TaxID=196820 RepID=UPI00332FDABB
MRVLLHVAKKFSDTMMTQEVDEQEEVEGIDVLSSNVSIEARFSAEEEELYTRHFENGYDLSDPKYERWLRIHHPIAASVRSEALMTGLLEGPSVTPVYVNLQLVQSDQENRVVESSIPRRSVPQSSSHLALTDEPIPSGTPSSTGSVSTPRCSPLAELVNTPRITQDKRTKTANARVLTNPECIRAFEVKEEQKRLAQEENRRGKQKGN